MKMTETVYEKIQAGTINIAREVRRVDFPLSNENRIQELDWVIMEVEIKKDQFQEMIQIQTIIQDLRVIVHANYFFVF